MMLGFGSPLITHQNLQLQTNITNKQTDKQTNEQT